MVRTPAGHAHHRCHALRSTCRRSSVVWSTAISFVWDEARNNAVTAPRVAGPIKGLLGGERPWCSSGCGSGADEEGRRPLAS